MIGFCKIGNLESFRRTDREGRKQTRENKKKKKKKKTCGWVKSQDMRASVIWRHAKEKHGDALYSNC